MLMAQQPKACQSAATYPSPALPSLSSPPPPLNLPPTRCGAPPPATRRCTQRKSTAPPLPASPVTRRYLCRDCSALLCSAGWTGEEAETRDGAGEGIIRRRSAAACVGFHSSCSQTEVHLQTWELISPNTIFSVTSAVC